MVRFLCVLAVFSVKPRMAELENTSTGREPLHVILKKSGKGLWDFTLKKNGPGKNH